MEFTDIGNGQLKITVKGQECKVFAHDVIAALAATLGAEKYLDALLRGHSRLGHDLFGQNFPDVETEPYDESDSDAGKHLEALTLVLNNHLHQVKNNLPEIKRRGEEGMSVRDL